MASAIAFVAHSSTSNDYKSGTGEKKSPDESSYAVECPPSFLRSSVPAFESARARSNTSVVMSDDAGDNY